MRRNFLLAIGAIILLSFWGGREALAQTDETPKYEVGAQFSSLTINNDDRTEPGFGGRFTYNITDNLAVEAEGNFFPHQNEFGSFRTGGRAIQGLAGVKLGKRYKRFGIFGKARPGFISFSEGIFEIDPIGVIDPSTALTIRTERLTHFAADLGGVLEFYPSRRLVTRFDFGDTIIRYGRTNINTLTLTPGGTVTTTPISVPGNTSHNFQFSAGVGFRF